MILSKRASRETSGTEETVEADDTVEASATTGGGVGAGAGVGVVAAVAVLAEAFLPEVLALALALAGAAVFEVFWVEFLEGMV